MSPPGGSSVGSGTTELADKVELLWGHAQIRECLYRYCRGVDRRDYDLLRSAYHPDAADDHGLYQGDVEGLIAHIKDRHDEILQSIHFLGESLIRITGDHAIAETQCLTYQYVRVGASKSQRIYRMEKEGRPPA